METLYYDPANPASYGSVASLQKDYSKQNDRAVKKRDVEDFLQGSDVYTQYRPRVLKFPRRMFMASRPGAILACDTAFMQSLIEHNNGVRYLIVVIDIFSKYLWIEPVKNIKSASVIKAFEKVLNELVWPSSRLNSDEGSEYTNKEFKNIWQAKM